MGVSVMANVNGALVFARRQSEHHQACLNDANAPANLSRLAKRAAQGLREGKVSIIKLA